MTHIRRRRTEEVSRSGAVQAQTIIFEIDEKPHASFERDGDDLLYKLRVPLAEALGGPASPASARKTLTTLDKRTVAYTIPYPSATAGGAPLRPGQEIVLAGEGFPISRAGAAKRKGDLRIVVDVAFPPRVTAEQAQGLKRLLA